jgi:hypothetical protein
MRKFGAALLGGMMAMIAAGTAQAQASSTASASATEDGYVRLRFATFNASLFGSREGEIAERLRGRKDEQIRQVAAVIQAVRPDVLLVNEFDYDPSGRAADDFIFNYLMRRQAGLEGIRYRFSFTAPVNTGLASPFDLNRDGKVEGPNDAWGFGHFPGQYGMLVLSRYPIREADVRTLRKFPWRDMPAAQLPVHESGQPWYSDTMLRWLPLSSKSHWDVPIWTGAGLVHFIVAHPTPPAFDGPEGRNRLRNHDEIRLIADYVSGDPERSAYIVDDNGRKGGLAADAPFVIAGDMNADPHDGASHNFAVRQLLDHPRVQAVMPASEGGRESAHRMGGGNLTHQGDPSHDTAVFGDPPGNLRVDYVLPSTDMRVVDSGVYWPLSTDNGAALLDASDHRLVWVDVEVPIQPQPARFKWGERRW